MNTLSLNSKKQYALLILILGSLEALTPFSIDMYLPAFTQIAGDLNTTTAKVSFSISTYFIGFALGQIIYGPLLDYFGRKKPLYAGLLIYILATIGIMNTHSIEPFLVLRFLQAIGGCVASVGAISMVRDFFPVEDSAKVFSMLMLVLSVSPLLAPTIGGFVVAEFGWRVIFAVLIGLGVLNLALSYFVLPEKFVPDYATRSLNIKSIISGFKDILKVRQFSTYVFAGSFSFAGLFVYIAGSPAMFMEGFKVSAQVYGVIFAILAVGMIGGGQVNLLLTKKFTSPQIFKTALFFQTIMGFIFLLGVYNNWFTLIPTVIILFLLLLGAGITYPNAAALALAPFEKNAGAASAMLGFLQLGIGSVASAGVGLLNVTGSLPTALAMFVSSLIGFVIVAARGET
ncbi:Bcr/CflA family drug resistance efflux transporter [Bdellovibrio sp. qaytius]|nr:Bcr/CflA family drug resistance efflux transporter [Bdellovibrio sp. qaytius]